MSITSMYAKKAGRRFRGHVETKSEKTIEGLKKWNQGDEESRKTCNMQMNQCNMRRRAEKEQRQEYSWHDWWDL
jgi:hypothetical protein